jgi:hypothetical protein
MKAILLIPTLACLLSGCAGKQSVIDETDRTGAPAMNIFSPEAVAAHEAYIAQLEGLELFSETPLGRAAYQTSAAYGRAVRAGETASAENIPPLYWADGIRELQPIRVYTHRGNLVVVQKLTSEGEEGKYIYIPISSYLPVSGVDGFEYTPDPRQGNEYHSMEVLEYKRKIESPALDPELRVMLR